MLWGPKVSSSTFSAISIAKYHLCVVLMFDKQLKGPLRRTIQCSCGVVSRPHTMGRPPSAFTPEPAALTSSSALGRVSCASITVPEPDKIKLI